MDPRITFLIFAAGVLAFIALRERAAAAAEYSGAFEGAMLADGGPSLLPTSDPASVDAMPTTPDQSGFGDADTDTLARTIYGEARGEADAGKQGVASVVMNRAHSASYNWLALFGVFSAADICLQPGQFSCWNAGNVNLSIIQQVTDANPVFQDCLGIAAQAVSGALPDNTGGADHYHDTSLSGPPASWGAVTRTVQIGHLIFYRSS